MVSVKLVNLTKRFGKVVAVDRLNLEVKDGEFVALLGPSGCGKTTTLLMIAGIYRPTEGEIYFNERLVNDLEPKDRNVGMVFQTYALYPHMKVFDNIAFPLKLKKVPKEEIRRKVLEVAKLLRIEELLERKPSQLSGGQQQRVALARALVKEPDLFLMDEPLSNLDAKLRMEMRGELKRLQKDLGITTIYVTHDQLEAMTMADRIAVLNKGRLQQYGPPEELYNRPANVFVARFIGSYPTHLIEGSLRWVDGNIYFDFGAERSIKLPAWLSEILRDAPSEVILGVRPESITLGQGGDLEGEVYLVEPMGREQLVTLRVGSLLLKALVPSYIRVKTGERVGIKFPDEVFLFEKSSGESLLPRVPTSS